MSQQSPLHPPHPSYLHPYTLKTHCPTTQTNHCTNWWISHIVLMSLFIRYTHIPFYFHFSFTSSTSSIHHYALQPHVTTLTLASSDQSCLFDGHMIYNSHVFTSILSISNMHPPVVWPIMIPCTVRSGIYYSFTSDEPYARFLVYHLYLTCLYFTFRSDHCYGSTWWELRSVNSDPRW